ncbi:MAG TPA: hypothetical protein VFV79_06920, partial [Saprospiraceae bacterium]|nr:hypothetical protein [Saprospiraceae bacterium]
MSHLPLLNYRLPVLQFKRVLSSFTFNLKPALALALGLAVTSLSAQRAGLNTDTPLAGLHIISDDGLLIQGEYGNGNLPVTGYGTRMLFNPKTGGFRTGRITDEDGGLYEEWWNFFNVGDYSIAAGVNLKASGYASAAFGNKTQANGISAFAAGGRSNAALGDLSFVAGFENTAQSFAEFVIGNKAESYTPNGVSYFDLNDRLFVVANGNNFPHNAMTILKNGNVGINNSNPQYLLHVDGNAKMQKAIIDDSLKTANLRITNGAGNGYVLQSDLNGNAVWTSPASIFTDDWSLNGNDIYNNNSGNIGIGANNPQDKLHVIGNLRVDQGRISFTNTGESIFIGDGAGDNDDLSNNSNVFIGQYAGQSTSTGSGNIAMGNSALLTNTSGNGNISVGEFSLFNNSTGGLNVAIGQHALETNETGNSNLAIGFFSGLNSTGDDNTFIGIEAGFNTLGNGNVFLGRKAGFDETGSNKLYIDNSETSAPLIYGDFSTNKITINDSLSTRHLLATQSSQVNGNLKINAGKISFTNSGQSVFIGDQAGNADDLSNNNSVFIGHQAGKANTNGANNIAIGAFALDEAANSNYNIAMGQDVMGVPGMSANYNTGIGNFSLANVNSGSDNIAIGQNAGGAINDGARNVSIGNYALDANTVGGYNTVIGFEALGSNVNGNNNTVMGHYAGNLVTGSNNVLIGYNAGNGPTGSGNIMIGAE